MPVFQAWQTGIPYEFIYRQFKLLNMLPAAARAFLGLLLVLVCIFLSVSQTVRFIR